MTKVEEGGRKRRHWRRRICLTGLLFFGLASLGMWRAGSALIAPRPQVIDWLPHWLAVEEVEFESETGRTLRAWFAPGEPERAGVVLLHSMGSNRQGMLQRAEILTDRGLGVLLIDFQANGESEGEYQTFGLLEAQDARAAAAYMRSRRGDKPLGVIGVSLGGAAALLGGPVDADAFVLEMVYPTLPEAVENRLALSFGRWGGKLFAPLLMVQCDLRLGFDAESVRPIDALAGLTAPVLIIGGEDDRRTSPEETRRMVAAAMGPKELWMVPGIKHEDLCERMPGEYARRVLAFFEEHLDGGMSDSSGG
ncbi:MAG: fermentation-respiration switch protein FrsA (DUF1100 family) [Planctomycetota bacterium]|jgi:fermentation-respiration switch protein FrsA (DUF1100 family)